MPADSEKNLDEHLRLYREADALYRQGKLRPAMRLMQAALSLAPGDSDTLWAIADCHSQLGHPWKAASLYRLARARAAWSERGDLLYNIANALLDQGRPRAALRLYLRVRHGSKAFSQARRNALLARRRLAG